MYSIHACLTSRKTYFDFPIHVLKNTSLIKYKFDKIQVLIFDKISKTEK